VSDPVEYLDVIFNGRTLYQARLDEYAKKGGKIPPQLINESGWLVIRVITEREHTYRLAASAPYYFEVADKPRISRSAVEFFQQWLKDSIKKSETLDAKSVEAAKTYQAAAAKFWSQKHSLATAP